MFAAYMKRIKMAKSRKVSSMTQNCMNKLMSNVRSDSAKELRKEVEKKKELRGQQGSQKGIMNRGGQNQTGVMMDHEYVDFILDTKEENQNSLNELY